MTQDMSLPFVLHLWTLGLISIMCAVVLLFSRDRNRVKTILGLILALQGIWYMVHTFQNHSTWDEYANVFNHHAIFSRNLAFYLFVLCVPLEVIRPGFWNWKSVLLVLAPYVAWSVLFFTLDHLGMVEHIKCASLSDVFENIEKFDVWGGRVMFMLMPMLAQILAILLYYRFLPFYRSYVEMNYADADYLNERWLKVSAYFNLVMMISFYLIVTSHPIQQAFVHSGIFLVLIVYQTVQALNVKIIPSVEEYSKMAYDLVHPEKSDEMNPASEEYIDSEKLNRLKVSISEWMEQEKPYLRVTFQQLDVMEKFDISRYMATKVFRDAFGISFADYVHEKRIQEACDIMRKNSRISIADLSMHVGYSSGSVFTRAFVKYMDVTPTKWKTTEVDA